MSIDFSVFHQAVEKTYAQRVEAGLPVFGVTVDFSGVFTPAAIAGKDCWLVTMSGVEENDNKEATLGVFEADKVTPDSVAVAVAVAYDQLSNLIC